MGSANKFTFYAPTSITSLVLQGATLTDGTILIEDNTFTGSYGGTGTEATSFTTRVGFSDTTLSTAFSSSSGYMVLNNVTVNGIGSRVWNYTGGYGYTYGGTFANNSNTGGQGGVIYANTTNNAFILRVKGTLFANNSADKGGAIYANTKSHVFYGATFSGNEATAHGGALFLVEGSTIVDTEFTNNSAVTGGGAIYRKSGALSVAGGVFRGNSSESGGAICVASSDAVTVSGTSFANNTGRFGGAIYIAATGSGSVFVDDVFSGNTALASSGDAPRGGAIYIQSMASTGDSILAGSTRSRFENNVSDDLGGAVFARWGASLDLYGSTFSGNTAATSGGAIYFIGQTLSIASVAGDTAAVRGKFAGNTAATGGAIYLASGRAGNIVDADFTGNTVTGNGGAIYQDGGTGTRIDGGVFSNNFASKGGALYSTGAMSISNTTFSGNRATNDRGGAIMADCDGKVITITDSVFSGNRATYGAAVFVNTGASVRIGDTDFNGNIASSSNNGAFWVHTDASAALTGTVRFLKSSDTVFLNTRAVLDITDATVTLNASMSVNSTATVNVTDSALVFGNTTAINVGALTFSGTDSVTFGGSAAVNFTVSGGQSLSGAAVSVDTGILPEGGTYTIATGVSAMNPTITVGGQSVTLGEETVIGGNTYTFALADGDFTVTRASEIYDTVAVAPEGITSVVICGETYALTHRYDTIEAAVAHLQDGGTIIFAGQSFSSAKNENKVMHNGVTTLIGDAITGGTSNILIYGNTFENYVGDVTLKLDRVALTADRIIPHNGGTVNGNWTVEYNNSSSVSDEIRHGYFIFTGGGVMGDVIGTIRNSDVANVLCFFSSATIGGEMRFTLSDSAVAQDIALSSNGNLNSTTCAGVSYTITGSCVGGDVYGGGHKTEATIGGDIDITLTGSTVFGSVIGDRANRIAAENTITVTLAGSSICGDLAKFDSGLDHQYVLADMIVNLSGATNSIIGNLSDADELVIGAGASVDFLSVQDLSSVSLTVDATGYAGTERTLATGVSAIGDYTITNKGAYEHLALYVENENLYMAEAVIVPDTEQASFTGGTLNIMTDGTITGAYVGIRNPAANADVKNVISGGTVGNSLIGGALVSSGSTATLGTVSLTIAGTTDIVGGSPNGGMVYTAGYAYGANPNVLDSSATLTVAKSVLNLTKGSAPAQNLYAGAHARKGAYTVVNQTEINVSGGSFARVYGGGWAEKVGLSEVGSSEIAISGGTVDYIYAGGGNAEGGTTVVTGNVSISVSGSAQVGIVFLAGKNQSCSITGNVTMTVLGSDKTMTRVSGYNANGDNNTGGTTMLDLRTSLDVEYLDHVDIVRIAEGETLNVSADLWYEAASALKIDFDLDGALDTDWTAMSGVGMNIYRSALYTIDGGSTVYTYDETSGKLVNGTTESGYGLDFSEANKVKFVTIA